MFKKVHQHRALQVQRQYSNPSVGKATMDWAQEACLRECGLSLYPVLWHSHQGRLWMQTQHLNHPITHHHRLHFQAGVMQEAGILRLEQIGNSILQAAI
jgi:hypothetical protein